MNRKFITRVVSEAGHYCIFASNKNKLGVKDPDHYKKFHKFTTNIDDFLSETFKLSNKGYDVYFATASFADEQRAQTNVLRMRSLFLDIDCGAGPKKDYPTLAEGLAALQKFCTTLSLPTPIVNTSGYGLHVFWGLTVDLEHAEWLVLAKKLKAVCAREGLRMDSSVPADAARVLRMPGTYNYKFGQQVVVEQLAGMTVDDTHPVDPAEFNNLLGEADPDTSSLFKVNPLAREMFGSSVMRVAEENTSYSFIKYIEALKANPDYGCKQFNHHMQHQHEQSEPIWHSMLSIVALVSDAEERVKAAKFISKRHPDYSEQETLNKLVSVNAERKGHRCSTFNERREGICAKCPHFGKINSPARFFADVIEATEEDRTIQFDKKTITVSEEGSIIESTTTTFIVPEPPKPYVRGKTGGVFIREVDDDGGVNSRLIYHNDFYLTGTVKDPHDGFGAVARIHLPQDGMQEFIIPLTAINNTEQFKTYISIHGIALTNPNVGKELQRYISTYYNLLQEQDRAANARSQFGWHDNNTSFVLGSNEYHMDGRVTHNAASRVTKPFITDLVTSGSLDAWQRLVSHYDVDGCELEQFVLCYALTGVLGVFTPEDCYAAMRLFTPGSGYGKTTIMNAYLSVWGNPKNMNLLAKDTKNAHDKILAVYKNLPIGADEITNEDGETLNSLLTDFTTGREKRRLTQSATLQEVISEAWNMPYLSTGNSSYVQAITGAVGNPEGALMRLVEFSFDKYGTRKPNDGTDDIQRGFMHNYGYAGIAFLHYFMANKDRIVSDAAALRKRLIQSGRFGQKHRFIIKTITDTLACGMAAKRAGLYAFDMDNLSKWVLKSVLETTALAETSVRTADEVFSNYYLSNVSSFVVIDHGFDIKKSTNPLLHGNPIPKTRVVGRYEPNTETVFVVPDPLNQYCNNRHIETKDLIDWMKAQDGYTYKAVRLLAGTGHPASPTKCHTFKWAAPEQPNEGEDDEPEEPEATSVHS